MLPVFVCTIYPASFGIISPQQCLAGQYCAGRAASNYGTGSCPQGYSCGPGSVTPELAPIGQFVGTPGSVLSYTCSAGSYSPQTGLARCLPCPPGYSCGAQGTIVPNLCAPGTYRSNSGSSFKSVSCLACGGGSFAPFRGVPDDISCEPCPAGRICLSQTANITSTNACSEGYLCGEATTLSSSTLYVCPAGFFCPRQTTPSSVYSNLCPVGFVCKSNTGFADRFLFRCPLGFYCPVGSAWTDQMDYPLQAPEAYLSRGQLYVIQTAALYCLRRIMATAYEAISEENARNTLSGVPNVTMDQQTIRLSSWTANISACVLLQIPYVSILASNAQPVSDFVLAHADWHAENLLLVKKISADSSRFTNKCIHEQFPRVDIGSTWDCLCTANLSEAGSFMRCLSSPDGKVNIGAPFTYNNSYPIDDVRNCADWPRCIDWAQVKGEDATSNVVSKKSGPSTGPAVDDFDAFLPVALIDYIKNAIYYDALLFGDSSIAAASNTCPFGTFSSLDGLTASTGCKKRVLALVDPDDMIVFRVSPTADYLTNTAPREGVRTLWEENQRKVFSVPANGFATFTVDTRDLPSDVQYGRDWRVMFFINATLEPDSNDPEICSTIWRDFLDLQAFGNAPLSYSAKQRDLNLTSHACTWVRNPIGFDAFQFSTGSTCPGASPGLCFFTSSGKTPCNVGGEPLKVQELYVHALQDVEVRIEVQILNGYVGPDRFKFVNSVAVDVQRPDRALVGTNNAFVVETNTALSNLVNYPFNLPTSNVSSAFVSWLPRNHSVRLTNCMRHTSAWEEFYINPNGYEGKSPAIFTTYLPYFSNCRGFGTATPLWFLLEKHPNCVLVPPNETVAISLYSFGASSVGDSCASVEIDCMVDEIPYSKQPVSRWFESPTGTELFSLSKSAMSASEMDRLTDSMDNVPVILRNGAASDGTSPLTVELRLRYWQKSQTEKILTVADVYFSNFTQLTDAQNKGIDAWNYTLQVSWSPMGYLEVFNAYAFPYFSYIVFAIVVGSLSMGMATSHFFFHWFMAKNRSRIFDKRYLTLLVPPLAKGVLLALSLVAAALLLMVIMFQAGTTWFTLSLYTCAAPDGLGCQYTFLDKLASSWSGESPSSPRTYAERRNGRAAITLLVLAVYIIMSTVKAFIPRLVSRFYDDKNEDEQERNWPPDQNTFVPPVFKRTAWFATLTGACIVCTVILEFSFSTAFTKFWWIYSILFLIVAGKIVAWSAQLLLVEELLKIPIMALFETVMHITVLGAPNLFAFMITAFATQTALLLDRIYLVPVEKIKLRQLAKEWEKVKKTWKKKSRAKDDDPDDSPSRRLLGNEPPAENRDPGSVSRYHLGQADRNKTDAMMYFLSSYTASAIAAILTPIALVILSMLYPATQCFNYYNISLSQSSIYFGFQFALLAFRFLADLISVSTAENFHEWKILDYLEYCRYRYVARPCRWKGVGEVADEMLTPELRSLDMMCFSSQFYFAIFLESAGLLLFLLGIQVTVNNAWNIFDDQATMFVIALGVAVLGVCKFTVIISADYLRVWYVKSSPQQLEEEEGADNTTEDNTVEEKNIGTLFAGKSEKIMAPVGSVLHGLSEPSPGDSAGWQHYRMAFLKENQLWLRAFMDSLVGGSTALEYRKLLMDSLAKILRESNVLELAENKSNEDGGFLAISALPPHATAVRSVFETHVLSQGTATQLAAQVWLTRSRFLRFLADSVSAVPLASAIIKPFCESCGATSSLGIVPEYPVAHVASQLRIQREFIPTWNMPLWQHFFSTFTPGCSLCLSCEQRFAYTHEPVPVQELRIKRLQSEPKPCHTVLRESPFGIPGKPLPEAAARLLLQWHNWAADCLNPDFDLDEHTAVPLVARRLALFWLERARNR